MNVNVTTVMSKITATIDAMTTKSHASLRPWPGNSINSIPDCIRGPGNVSHIYDAEHNFESF